MMSSLTNLSMLVLLLLASHLPAALSAPAVDLEAVPPDSFGRATPGVVSTYPVIIPGPSLRAPFERLVAERGLTAAYFFNETAQRELRLPDDDDDDNETVLLRTRDRSLARRSDPHNAHEKRRLSKRWGLECLSVNRAPQVGAGACRFLLALMHAERLLEGNLPGEGASALCSSVDNVGRRTSVFLVTGGPEPPKVVATPGDPAHPAMTPAASSYARDVLVGFDAILESCSMCPDSVPKEKKADCAVGGTNSAAGNGAMGIWLVGEIPDGVHVE